MKKTMTVLFMAVMGLMITSCSTQTKKENTALKAEIDELKKQNAELSGETYTMSSEIGEYRLMLEEIEENIAAYDDKSHTVKSIMSSDNNDEDVEEDILLHIEHMHGLSENSKHKVAYLDKNVKQLRQDENVDQDEVHMLEMEVRDLAITVVEKDNEIDALHEEVAVEGIDITELVDAYEDQAIYTDVLEEIINTAFFVAGTKKELKVMGVLDMEGGFIGMGRVKKLNDDASLEFMVPVDVDQTDIIELDGKKAELVTPHSADSYSITYNKETNVTILEISNKLQFWQETNYLVIEIKN